MRAIDWKTWHRLFLVAAVATATSAALLAAGPTVGQAQGFPPGTIYEAPSPTSVVSGIDAFAVDATVSKQVSIALRGPEAVVVVWPVGASLPEEGLRLLDQKERAADAGVPQIIAPFMSLPAEGLPDLVDLPPSAAMARVGSPAPGSYVLDFSQTKSGAKAYLVAVRDGSPLRMAVSLAELSVPRGGRQVVEARLFDETTHLPLTGFRVEARLREGRGTASLPLMLHDDGTTPDEAAGDGVYAADLPDGAPGEMVDVKVDAYGAWGGLPLHRVAQTAFARHGGRVFIRSVDKPILVRDGEEVQALHLAVHLTVRRTGTYRVQAILTGQAQGREVLVAAASVESSLAGKAQDAILEFPGDTLALAGAEPPFTVRDLSVASMDKVEIEDTLGDVGRVAGFTLAQCPAPQGRLETPVKAVVP